MPDFEEQDRTIEAQAALWLVRVNAPDVTEHDIAALTEWLNQSPAHVEAFHQAEIVWARVDDLAKSRDLEPHPKTSRPEAALVVALNDYQGKRPLAARGGGGMTWAAWTAAGLAAAVAVVTLLPSLLTRPAAPSVVYQTARGQLLQVALPDGSHLVLNSDTQVSVQLETGARRLQLDHGEAAFTVTHDAKRPFIVQAGDLVARDIGTQFDVSRHDGLIRVAVRSGQVDVSLKAEQGGSPSQTLSAGDQTTHKEDTDALRLERADLDAVFAWQQKRVVYRDLPLSSVVSDLNHYLEKPLVVDGQAAQIRLTAAFALGSEESVVRELQSFLPIDAVTTKDSILLRPRR